MDDNIETIEYNLDSIPEEVKDYIFGFHFSKEFSNFCETQGFSEQEKSDFEIKLYGYLAQINTEESLIETIHSISKTPEMNQTIINWVKEKVTEPVFNITVNTAVAEEESEEVNTEILPNNNITPLQALESIKSRLAQNKAITPTARDYSIEKAQPATEKPTIDPYREVPEQ